MEVIKLIFGLFDELVAIIKAVEKLFPETGQGSAKLEFIKELLIEVSEDYEEHWATIEKVIGFIVKFLNKTGVFKKE